MLVAAEDHGKDNSWNEIWPQLEGEKEWIVVNKTTHLSFTDGPVIMDLLKAEEKIGKAVKEAFVGAISGKELVKTMNRVYGTFFGRWV